MSIFLEIVIISLGAWVVVAVYRAISCARFNRALRAEAPSSQELGPAPSPTLAPAWRADDGKALGPGSTSRRLSQRERRSA